MTMTGDKRPTATAATPRSEPEHNVHSLLQSLGRELFQTETSAQLHCRREAARLGDAPPAAALHEVADHASRVLAALPELARKHDMPISAGGRLTGALFSAARDKLLDRLLHGERSYRGTLLGMRHGVDVVLMLDHLADVLGDSELASFCDSWLDTRVPLVKRAEDELSWFAHHPEMAVKQARKGGLRQRVSRRPPAKTDTAGSHTRTN